MPIQLQPGSTDDEFIVTFPVTRVWAVLITLIVAALTYLAQMIG